MLLHPMITPANEGADRRRCRIKNIHPMLFNDLPETIRFGLIRHPFIHQGSRSITQSPVHCVTVSRHPPHIGRAPEQIGFLQIKHPLCR